MFDQLDDPHPPAPDRARYDRVVERASAIRHRRRRRTAGIAAGTVAAGVLGVVGFASYDVHRLDGIDKVSVSAQLAPTTSGGAETFLLVGTDRNLFTGIGVLTAGADTILAVRVAPADRSIVALQLPRDLRVPTSKGTLTPRLTQVFRSGGPSALLAALHDGLGLTVQHYVSIDPAGFVDMVDLVGGTRITSEHDLRDLSVGLQLEAHSCTSVDGAMALELARSRHAQTRDVSGVWRDDRLGDLGRIQRQAVLSQALLSSFRSMDVHDPIALHRMVDALAAHATVDPGLGATALIRLAEQVHDLADGRIEFALLPVSPGMDGGSAYLDLGPGWQTAVGSITGTEQPPVSTTRGGPTTAPTIIDTPAAQLAIC